MKQQQTLTLKEVFLKEEEDNVVDMASFKRKKEASKPRAFVATKDGVMLFHPDDLVYIVITDDDQGEAVGDGDLERAKAYGARLFTVEIGKEDTTPPATE